LVCKIGAACCPWEFEFNFENCLNLYQTKDLQLAEYQINFDNPIAFFDQNYTKGVFVFLSFFRQLGTFMTAII
jgi:hypothetical protein